jgi:predicted permease
VPTDLTYKSDAEMEKAYVQYVSGWMFDSFGLRPAAGRLFTEDDDSKPRAHAYAVLSYEYWTRRFGRDPKVVGRTFQMGSDFFQIIGVGPEHFTGTETGIVTDVFLPTMMHPAVTHDDWTWHRTLARVRPGVAMEPLRAKLDATSRAFERERAKGFNMTRETIERFLMQKVFLEPAAAGASGLRDEYRTALAAMGVLVALVLLIACANVANLMTAQAAARAREMALRVSIGAGRGRLVQLVLVESAWLAAASAALGAWLAWWSAPLVVSRINPPDHPVRLALPADWRVLAFGIALTLAVTLLFGLAPALRASKVNPVSALRGGASSPHSRRRLMHTLIAAQVAFCFVVLFVAGLFAATFDHLLHRPMGFSADRVLTLDAVSQGDRPAVFWEQAADRLRDVPGVESVALAAWPLLSNNSWNGFVSVNGAPPGPVDAEFMKVSPGWLDTMKLPLVAGRDFRPDDSLPGSAIVNETFVRLFLNGLRPIGVEIAKGSQSFQVVGVVRDTPYRDIHEDIRPVVFVPFHSAQQTRNATFVVRTASANPLAMASTLRRAVTSARVSNIRPQMEFVQAQTVRERLMAMLALFFAAVALVLAAIGLVWRTGLLRAATAARDRHSNRHRRAVRRNRAARDRGRVSHGGGRRAGGVRLGNADGALYRRVAVPGAAGRSGDAGAAGGDYPGRALVAALPAVYHAIRIDPVAMLRAD